MKTISFILMVMSFVLLGFIWGLELAPAPHVDTTPIIHVVKNNSGEVLCEIATKSFEAGFANELYESPILLPTVHCTNHFLKPQLQRFSPV